MLRRTIQCHQHFVGDFIRQIVPKNSLACFSTTALTPTRSLLLQQKQHSSTLSKCLAHEATCSMYGSSSARRFFHPTTLSSAEDNDNQEWVPPSRPLGGDRGQTQLYQKLEAEDKTATEQLQVEEENLNRLIAKEEEIVALMEADDETALNDEDQQMQQLEEAMKEFEDEESRQESISSEQSNDQVEDDDDEPIDWLQVRRKKFQDKDDSLRQELDLPVLEGTMLEHKEIEQILNVLGGTDVHVIFDNPDAPRMGGGVQGMIMCTAPSSYQMITMSEGIVHQLKLRGLQKLGVVGASKGSEKSFGTGRTSSVRETWRVVDCGNFIVHIQDEVTRRSLRLDDLWSGKDPVWTLDWQDDDKVEDYVGKYPVPDEYERLAAAVDISAAGESNLYRYLTTTRYTRLNKPIVPAASSRRSKGGRRRRR